MMLPYLPTINAPIMYPMEYQNFGAQNFGTQNPHLSYNYNNSLANTSFAAANPFGSAAATYTAAAAAAAAAAVPHPGTLQTSTAYTPQSFMEKISAFLPAPPLVKVPNRPNFNQQMQQKRSKRKSKFTVQQDEMIINLKRNGKNWVEIAEITKVGSYLAARNRYQVIIGQQGNNNSSSWSSELNLALKKLIDKYEVEKWKFITKELNKIFNRDFDYKEVQSLVQSMFEANPYSFKVNDELIHELVKEKKITDKAHESVKNNDFDDFLNYQIDNEYNDLM
nr:actin depolymerizing factor, cofilin [Yamadazyma tenuis]